MNQKNFKIDMKSISDMGTFEGFASVYGNTDLAKEIVEKGAFKRTLDHSDTITLLWQHDTKQPIGIGRIEDTDKGLKIYGELNLETQKGKEAHSLMKQKAIKGLSIGYDVVKDNWEKGLRYLKEVKLWEVSIVTFPCNELAGVNSVKSVEEVSQVKDFNTILQHQLSDQERWMMEDAFRQAIMEVIHSDGTDSSIKVMAIDTIFDQYKAAFLSWLNQSFSVGATGNQVYEKMGPLVKDVQLGDDEIDNKSADSGNSHSDEVALDLINFDDIVEQMKNHGTTWEIDLMKDIELK